MSMIFVSMAVGAIFIAERFSARVRATLDKLGLAAIALFVTGSGGMLLLASAQLGAASAGDIVFRVSPDRFEMMRQKALSLGMEGAYMDDNLLHICLICRTAINLSKGLDPVQAVMENQGKSSKQLLGMKREHARLTMTSRDLNIEGRFDDGKDARHDE